MVLAWSGLYLNGNVNGNIFEMVVLKEGYMVLSQGLCLNGREGKGF